ncbi:pinopsin-like [Bombyx mori]|uniref:pinopsin-like n=1 Tax=Bombyx mori TaxID=7091 RepID=UPI002ED66C22
MGETEREDLKPVPHRRRIFSVALCAWVTGTILLTDLRSNWSYKNLANFYIIACIRRLLPTILNNLTVFLFFLSDVEKCDVDGFLETFFAVFEVEFLTHICIERYVIAKYVNNGWDLKNSHYTLYYFLSVMFSFVYSAPPLFGVVGFARDFTCTSCILDMIFPGTWENALMIAIFVLRSVKPAIFMIIMLKWASKLERQCINCDKIDMQLTNSIVAIIAAHFICWAPIVFIRGLVIISQLLNINPMVYLCADWISWAMWMHWIAPAVSVITLFATNDRICYYSYGVFVSSKPDDDGKEKEH